MKAPTETSLVNAVLDFFRLRNVLAWRMNAGGVLVGDARPRRHVRLGPAGCPDVIAALPPGGKVLGVECKQPGRKPTAAQRAFGDRIVAAGGLYLVVSDLAQLARALDLENIP
jgi:hypothetical protein